MLRIILVLLSISVISFNPTAANANGYISDNVYVFMHTGPSAKFRILGSVVSGSKIEILEKSEDNTYTKITDDKGRTGWIKSEFSSTTQSTRERFELLQEQFNRLNSTKDKLSQQTALASKSNIRLEQHITRLTSELATAERLKQETEAKLVGEEADIQLKWFIRGGILVIISMLFGVLVTFLPGKKKSKGNWA